MGEVFARVIPLLIGATVVVVFLLGMNWLLLRRRKDLGNERRLPRQVAMAILTLVGVVAIVLVLPIEMASRNQIIGLIGLLISAVIALSSTTIIANAMAGLLMRATRPFRVGDHIKVGDHTGRVTERGLFDTEVQTEFRELISIPNTFLITNPVTTLRSSGTVVSCTLSLGFDVHHARIEGLLIAAAEQTDWQNPSCGSRRSGTIRSPTASAGCSRTSILC